MTGQDLAVADSAAVRRASTSGNRGSRAAARTARDCGTRRPQHGVMAPKSVVWRAKVTQSLDVEGYRNSQAILGCAGGRQILLEMCDRLHADERGRDG